MCLSSYFTTSQGFYYFILKETFLPMALSYFLRFNLYTKYRYNDVESTITTDKMLCQQYNNWHVRLIRYNCEHITYYITWRSIFIFFVFPSIITQSSVVGICALTVWQNFLRSCQTKRARFGVSDISVCFHLGLYRQLYTSTA